MSEAAKRAAVLVVAADPARRLALATRIGALRPAKPLAPSALREATRLVDHTAAFALLSGSDEAALEALAPLRELPAGSRLVLVADGVAEPLLEKALARLAPLHLLVEPVGDAALHFALEAVSPPSAWSESARQQHRTAPSLLGVSQAIREILDQLRRVAPTRAAVLILGETGTGKELVARALHQQSPRVNGRFVAVNCASLPEALLEAELFGFRRGAFTGADRDKLGLFQTANAGTLFLDEIGDMPSGLQAKLLRVLESGEVRPLGATEAHAVDVRLVSATHRDLEEAIESGAFRQDLFYRLNTVTIYVPPLRRRRVDVPFLAQHFAEELGASYARHIVLGEDFLESLSDYDFPGNVRELRNAVERAIALAAPGQPLGRSDLPRELQGQAHLLSIGTLQERVQQVELRAIREALELHGGNVTRAAEALGLSRVGLRAKMRRLGLARR